MTAADGQSEEQKLTKNSNTSQTRWRGVGLVFLCFVAGALGSIIISLAGGDLQQTVTNNTREVVSSEGELIAKIAEELSPSTVSITTQSVASDGFYGPAVQEGAGTGMIVSKDGYILTNRHVIPDTVQSVNVVASDGKLYEDVKVIGRDTLNDIAFLKVSGVNELTPVKLGSSTKVKVGQKVVAVGNALGQFQNTVTTGVISGKGRPLVARDGTETEQLENLFQTDAAINPGNSGGPLVNLDGEVIAINTAIAEEAEGIGFAIPIDDAKGLIASVTKQGRLIRPYLGLRTVTLTPEISEEIGTNETEGAYVLKQNGVLKDGPAEKAGIKASDIVAKVNGKKIIQQSLGSIISQYKVGDEVILTIKRGNDQLDLKARLAELPNNLSEL